MSDASSHVPPAEGNASAPNLGDAPVASGESESTAVGSALIGNAACDADGTALASRSPRQVTYQRLRRDRLAMTCLMLIAVIVLVALFAPMLTRLMGINPYDFHPELISDDGGLPIGRWGGIGWPHILGVEPLTGRDLFARLLFGARTSLFIALTATLATVAIGVFVGIVAGYSAGWLDAFLGRFMDIVLAFPLLLAVIALAPVLDQRLAALGIPSGNPSRVVGLILVLSVFGWPYLARIIRGQVLSLRERDYVLAARSMGARSARILRTEVLPGLTSVIVIYATVIMPSYIAAEAALAYLGISVQPPTPTWGAMLDDSVTYFTVDPFYFFVPMAALLVSVLSFNLLGDALRDALQGHGDGAVSTTTKGDSS